MPKTTAEKVANNTIWFVQCVIALLLLGLIASLSPKFVVPLLVFGGLGMGAWAQLNKDARTMTFCGRMIFLICPLVGLVLMYGSQMNVLTHYYVQDISSAWQMWLMDPSQAIQHPYAADWGMRAGLVALFALPVYWVPVIAGQFIIFILDLKISRSVYKFIWSINGISHK